MQERFRSWPTRLILAILMLGVAYASERVPRSRLWYVAIPIGFAVLWRGGLVLPASVPAGLLGGTVIVAAALFSPTVRIPFLPTLGDASYSLYLTHVITLAGVAALWTHQSVLTGALLFGSICIAAAIAVAVLREPRAVVQEDRRAVVAALLRARSVTI